jgi:cytochrome b561
MIERLRAWARAYADDDRYTPVGVAFHWVMAFLILFQLGWGWYMSMLPVGGDKIWAFEVHSAAGLPILVLGAGRFVWRALVPGPVNDADNRGWRSTLAYSVEYAFYVAFFGLPLSGWMMWSSVGDPQPLSFAGMFPWPLVPLGTLPMGVQAMILDVAEDVHIALIIGLLVLVPLHVAAALKHHFWDRNDVLRGILPEIPDAEKAPEARRHSRPASQSRRASDAG